MNQSGGSKTPSGPKRPPDPGDGTDRQPADRREFIKTVGTVSLGLAVTQAGTSTAAESGEAPLPDIPFGTYRLSRLICGSNPFNAGSHLSTFVDRAMRSYYTLDQVVKTLRRCEEVGINCWQISGVQNLVQYQRLLDAGSRMHTISLGRHPAELPILAKSGCIAVAHHGEITDQLFKTGRLDKIRDFLLRVRDAGMLAGVSTHMPDVVDAIESNGWDVDYYMTCVYERHRSAEELKQLLGHVPLPAKEVYLQEDPPRMFRAIRNTERPCLAFKILAAGRLSDRKEWVERAFRETFQNIKPTDGVIVGIYDRYSDQSGEDASLVRQFGTRKG